MKKIKFLIASMIGAIALVFAAVLGTKVNAATTFYTASMTGEDGAATTFSADDEIISDSNLKLEIIGCTAVESARSLSSYTVALAAGGNGGTSKYFKLTSLSSNDLNVTVYFADYNSDGSKLQAKAYTFGTQTGTTEKAINSVTEKIKSSNFAMLYSAGRCNIFKITYEIVESDNTKYTITYYDSDKTTELFSEELAADDLLSYTPNDKSGFEFAGWVDDDDNKVTRMPSGNIDVYATWSKVPVAGLGTTLTLDDVDATSSGLEYGKNLIIDGTIYTFMATASVPVKAYQVNKTIGGVQYDKYIQFGGSSKFNSSGYARMLKIDTKFDGTLNLVASSNGDSARLVTLYDENGAETSQNQSINGAGGVYTYELEENNTYYIAANGDLRIFHAEFVETVPAVSTPVLEQQESADGSSIRYIATIETEDTDLIVSWNATYTLEGQTEDFTTADFTTLYKAVAGTNGKAAATNTYYLVVTLKNIPSNYSGRELTCTINVKLEGGQTISSNTKTYTL